MGGFFLGVLYLIIGFFVSVPNRPLQPQQLTEEQAQLQYLEKKIGECAAIGGIARLDPRSGYLGCDLPIVRHAQR